MYHILFSSLIALTLAGSAAFGQKPKIATIDASKTTSQYHLSNSDFEAFDAARKELEENARKKELDLLQESLTEKVKEYREMVEKDPNRTRLAKEISNLKQDYEDLLSLWRTFRRDKLRQLTDEYVSNAEKRNAEIIAAARKLSESKGFDWVVETSGSTSSKMPVVLYVRNSTDITEELITFLNKEAPVKITPKANTDN